MKMQKTVRFLNHEYIPLQSCCEFLVDSTNGGAYATVLCPSVVCEE